MVAYTVTDGTDTYPLAELEISYTGTDLDEAQFVIAGEFALDTAITIYADTTAQFYGYIKEIEEVEQGALYKYVAYEKAIELKTMPYLSSSSDIFTKSSITVYNLASDIITSTPASGWTLASGLSDSTSVTINFYMVNRLQALNKVLREMRGCYVIFDSNAKTVKWLNSTGINTDRTGTDIVYQTKMVNTSSMLRGITQVVVIGQDSSIRGEAGSSTSSRIYYQVDDITSNDEATKIATAILADVGVSYETYRIIVDPDQIQYDVRDKITVDGSDYWITSLTQAMDSIELIIDDGRTSVIDSLGSRIHVIEGNFPAGSDISWNGGTQNVSNTPTSKWTIDIKDVSLISNFILKTSIAPYRKTVTASTTTDYLSDVSQVVSVTAYTDTTLFGSGYTYLPSTSGLSVSISNGIQFAMASCSGTVRISTGSACYLTCNWQYSYNGSTWYDVGTYWYQYYNAGSSSYSHQLSHSALITGTTGTTIYLRLRCAPSTSSAIGIYDAIYLSGQAVTRHLHSVPAQTDDIGDVGSAPSTVIIGTINGTYYGWSKADGGTQDITSYLVNGRNTISVFANVGEKANVTLTGTYQTLGKS